MGAAFALSVWDCGSRGRARRASSCWPRSMVPATLEAVFGYCVGCRIFALAMRVGLLPASVCAECEDIWSGRVQVPPQRGLAVD